MTAVTRQPPTVGRTSVAGAAGDGPTEERARVVDAYARREDEGRYDPRRADQVAMSAARARVWGRALLRSERIGTVLEVGCGHGAVTRWALDVGAERVVGVDVIPKRIGAARCGNPAITYAVADGRALPLATGSVDVACCSTLFSSVLRDSVASTVAAEIDRVLAPNGVVLWFDFFRDNPANRDVRGVTSRDIARLFPGYEARLERVVLAPPIARRLVDHPRVAAILECAPPLRTHLAGALVRR
jgi:SAM-dependent methyltransferase